MNLAIQRIARTIPAGGTITVDAAGTFVLFYAATGSFNFSIDGGPFQGGFTALSITVPPLTIAGQTTPAAPFRQIVLQDTSGVANVISMVVANGPVDYTPTQPTNFAKNSPTYAKATGNTGIADGGSVTFSGVDGANTRKQIVITNTSGAGGPVLYLCDSANGNQGIPIYPGATPIPITIEVSGGLILKNPPGSGGANFMAIETFYQ